MDFLTIADSAVEGIVAGDALDSAAAKEAMRSYILDTDKAAWVCEQENDLGGLARVAMIACRFRQWPDDRAATHGIFDDLDPAVFPEDGRFCEIFQLWVDSTVRRLGIASQLKREVEKEANRRGVRMIYTHTAATNVGVIALNEKLGYHKVGSGKIWDDVIRVRLVKYLSPSSRHEYCVPAQ